jgi:hypothetical protein
MCFFHTNIVEVPKTKLGIELRSRWSLSELNIVMHH